MPLNKYQKHILRDIRTEQQNYGLKFISLTTGAGYSALDAYRKQTYSEIETYFSGALLFNPSSAKRDAEAGFYQVSDLVIIASRDHKTTAQAKDTKVQYESIKFRIARVVDCEDTNEIVIYANRLE
jgi:hypothetical protein